MREVFAVSLGEMLRFVTEFKVGFFDEESESIFADFEEFKFFK